MRILLAAVLGVSFVATIANGAEAPGPPKAAEVPWVLWAEYRETWLETDKPVRTEEGFFIVDALESKRECLATLETEIARQIQRETPQSGDTGVQRRGRLGNILLWRTGDKSAKNMMHTHTYLCYPVGLEPGWRVKKEWTKDQ
jgi:hypothetical protein